MKIKLIILLGILLVSGTTALYLFDDDFKQGVLERVEQVGIIESADLDRGEEYLTMVVKTSDNVYSKLPKENWTKEMNETDMLSYKQGHVVQIFPGIVYANSSLSTGADSFAFITIPKSEWNESLLEIEWDYDRPILGLNVTCAKNCIKDEKSKNNSIQYCESICDNQTTDYFPKKRRKYYLPLDSFLNTTEIDDLRNITYNSHPNWTIQKNMTNVSSKIENYNWSDREEDMKLHGSSGNFTICPSGCSYPTLALFESNEADDLRGSGPAIANIIEGGFTDSSTVFFWQTWVTDTDDYIGINVIPSVRHNGVWNDSLYHINVTNDEAFYIYGIGHFVIDGIQIRNQDITSEGSGVAVVKFHPNALSSNITLKNSIIRGANSDDYAQSLITTMGDSNLDLHVYNSLIYDAGADSYSYGFSDSNVQQMNVYSTTISGAWAGVRVGAAFRGKNILCLNASYECFYCGFGDLEDLENVATDDTTPSDCSATNSRESQTFDMVDSSGANNLHKDFHLNSNDTGALDYGIDLSCGNDDYLCFEDDIDYEERTGTWDIGADEFVSAVSDTASPNVTIDFPANDTYTTNNLDFNITIQDDSSVDCNYTLDNGENNITMTQSGSTFSDTNTSMTQGTHTASFLCEDESANQNFTENVTFFIDSIIPNITIDLPTQDGNFSNATLNINFSVIDTNLEDCWYSNNSGEDNSSVFACANNLTGNTWIEGDNNVTIYANDTLNNIGQNSVNFFVDTRPPNVTISTPLNTTYTTNTIEFNATINDSLPASCQYTLDNGENNVSMTQNVNLWNATNTSMSQGTHTVIFLCNDTLLNLNASENVTFFIDSINPNITIDSPIQNGNFSSPQLDINFSAIDTNLEDCWYSNNSGADNSTVFSCAGNLTGNTWEEGVNNVTIYGNDTLNNIGQDSVYFFIDTIPPNVTIDTPSNITYSNITIEFNVTVLDSLNTTLCEYTFNNGEDNLSMSRLGNVWNATNSTMVQGSTTVIFLCNDTLNNLNASENVTFFIDSIFPEINITYPENTTYANPVNHMNYTYNDVNVDTCQWSSNLGVDNTTIACGTNVSVGSVAGSNTWEMYINDSLGQINKSSVTFVVTSNPPVATMVSPVNNSNTSNTALSVNFTIQDDDLFNCWYSNDTFSINTTFTCGNNITDVNWSEGIHNVTVYGNDSDGNIDSANVIFTIDTTDPVVSIEYPSIGANFGDPQVPINFSITELYIEDCWWSEDEGATNSSIFTCADNLTGQSWSDGENELFIYANDSSGNIGSGSTIFTIDNIPPDVTINSPGNTTFTSNSIDFDFFADDPLPISACNYSIDGDINVSMTLVGINWTDTNTSLAEGSHTVFAFCWDSADNLNNTENVTFVIDTTTPTVNITQPLNNSNFSTQLDINFTINGTNLDTCWFTNNSGTTNTTLSNCVDNLTAITAEEGINNFTLYANNSLGTQGSGHVQFRLDTTAPVITNQNFTHTVNTTFSQTLVATDSGVGVGTFSLNNTDIFNISNTGVILNVTALTNISIHYLEVTVNDTLNNSASTIIFINITVAPGTTEKNLFSWRERATGKELMNLSNFGNLRVSGNVTANWFHGLFNWFTDSSYLTFNGSTLVMNDTLLNLNFNQTDLINSVNTTANIEELGFVTGSHTTPGGIVNNMSHSESNTTLTFGSTGNIVIKFG